MDDVIYRQDAINDIKAIYEYHDTVTEDRIIDHLKRLPSAQPDVPDTNVGDMISRQAAIDALGERLQANGYSNVALVSELNRSIGYLRQLPSVDAQPVRHGHWIIKDNPGTGWYRVTCSECGEDVTSVAPVIGFFPNARVTWDFCYNCGAKMDGEHDG